MTTFGADEVRGRIIIGPWRGRLRWELKRRVFLVLIRVFGIPGPKCECISLSPGAYKHRDYGVEYVIGFVLRGPDAPRRSDSSYLVPCYLYLVLVPRALIRPAGPRSVPRGPRNRPCGTHQGPAAWGPNSVSQWGHGS